MSESGKAVFLSYASQDAGAARRISEALRAAGVEVWFDQSELRGGDAWDANIRRQIRECTLFVALISAQTQSRREGYFRREWKLAADRTQDMAEGTPFLLPVAVDGTREQAALVPESFLHVQWTWLPAAGDVPPAFVQRVSRLLGGGDAPAPAAVPVRAPAAAGSAPPVASAAGTPSIAVLPFVNLSPDAENEYFADGLAEELLNVLAKIRGLRVAARTSSFSFKGQTVDIPTIAGKLNVATVLEGSVRKAGNRVRITAQLINAADGYHLWSETYNRELEDIFAVQDDIAQSVVKELQAKLLGAAGERSAQTAVETASRGRTTNAEAHRLALQGRFFFQRHTIRDMAAAISYFEQAVALDPQFALGWSGLAHAIYWQTAFGISEDTGAFAAGFARAETAVSRALALEPELPEGLLVLSYIIACRTRNLAGSAQAIRRALALAPGDATIVAAAVVLVLVNGYFDEAQALARRSLELDPLNEAGHAGLARSYFHSGRLVEAEAQLRKAIELNPQARGRHLQLSLTLLRQGRVADAEAAAAQEPEKVFRILALGIVHWTQGRRAEADALLAELMHEFGVSAAYQVAELHGHRGEIEAAFTWLERAFEIYDPGIYWTKIDDLFAPLHADPRWPAYLRKLGFPD
ncbi:MAG TPA: TIR domain-containing protein [Opitutaceae bacterium]|nr:TIR domain-containing protein [Opitutaceae bacterium]